MRQARHLVKLVVVVILIDVLLGHLYGPYITSAIVYATSDPVETCMRVDSSISDSFDISGRILKSGARMHVLFRENHAEGTSFVGEAKEFIPGMSYRIKYRSSWLLSENFLVRAIPVLSCVQASSLA